ncbi:MAG: hypothetical protein JNG82_01325 [Opitutaceae bacterium]|nr:hypothetical protein [Opitutaceae bacterium]
MSATELQNRLKKLSPGERRSVGKYVSYVIRRNSVARQRQLTRLGRDMSAGKKYSQAQLDAILAGNPPFTPNPQPVAQQPASWLSP